MTSPKIINLDFDGVLHSYTSEFQGVDEIPDPPVPGAIEWLIDTVHRTSLVKVNIYSVRSRRPEGLAAMQNWLREHITSVLHNRYAKKTNDFSAMDKAAHEREYLMDLIGFPLVEKPRAHIYIDDHAFRFEGEFLPLDEYLKTKAWHKTSRSPSIEQRKVAEFMRAFGVEVSDKPMNGKYYPLLNKLIQEEAKEFDEAARFEDHMGMADAMCDLIYVVYHAANAMGINLSPLFDEVHRTNMNKLGPDGKPIRDPETNKILKPEGWEPPDLMSPIMDQNEPEE